MKIRKAVFPVAGLGTRFLPATKATPKEMLPIVDKPLIQYAVEEAIKAGITQLIFVTSSSKNAIENHFDSNFELETILQQKQKNQWLEVVRNVLPEQIDAVYIRQAHPLGLGHAVLCAQQIVGDEPFAVLLADDLIKTNQQERSCLEQMVTLFEKLKSTILACQLVDFSETEKYGIVDTLKNQLHCGEYVNIRRIIEKPKREQAPSNVASIGRYILTPEIFEFLNRTPKGTGGEIQLTDGIEALLRQQDAYAYCFQGQRYDCGSKIGYLKATIDFALDHPEVGTEFKAYLKRHHY